MSQNPLYVCIYVSITHPLSTVGTNHKNPTVQGHQRNNKFYEGDSLIGECHLEDDVLHILLTWHLYHFFGLTLQFWFQGKEEQKEMLQSKTVFGIKIDAVVLEIVVDEGKK